MQAAAIGNDGLLGIGLLLGSTSSPTSALVHTAGYALRLDRVALLREFETGGHFHEVVLRYAQVLMTQMAISAVCNRYHTVSHQLGRWLLFIADRVGSSELVLTQELLANMLGVRRESVTHAARGLQTKGVIHYHRGHLRILDRAALEHEACECYALVALETERLMAPTQPRLAFKS